jgi:hypothetical protein
MFSNGSFKESLLNGSVIFLGLTFTLTFIFLLPPITFAPIDYPSHRSLIPIQRSKNENLKTEIPHITNPREKRERREKKDRRNKNRNPTISISNVHNF